MLDIIDAHGQVYDDRVLMAGFINPRNKKIDDSITIVKLRAYDRTSSIKRIFSWTAAFLKALWIIKTKYRKADLFLVSNPPLALFLPLFCRNSFRILIYDVYPDALISYKMMGQHSRVANWWRKTNKKIFSRAEKIYTIGHGMKQLIAAYVEPEKIKVVPVWTDNSFLKPIRKQDNPFIQQQQLQDKFIVLYSGNLGKTQEVEVLITLAEQSTDPQLFFLIIGEGDKYLQIEQKIKQAGLKNIRLLPWQPTDQLPFTLASADIAVVSLGKEAAMLSVPSKTYNYLSVGAPLLCIASPASELSAMVNEFKVGACFEVNEVDEMLNFVQSLKNNPKHFDLLSERALEASQKFSSLNALEFI